MTTDQKEKNSEREKPRMAQVTDAAIRGSDDTFCRLKRVCALFKTRFFFKQQVRMSIVMRDTVKGYPGG